MTNKEIVIDKDISLEHLSINRLKEFFSLCQRINKSGMNYLPEMVKLCTDLESTHICLDDYQVKYSETEAPDFFIKLDGEIVGVIGFHPWKKESPVAEMAFWVSPESQGKGVATRAVNFLTSYSFDKFSLNKIELLIEFENTKSISLARKCGFQLGEDRGEGTMTYKNYFQLC
jgi:ribosomal-protein-serine acetyltransferase